VTLTEVESGLLLVAYLEAEDLSVARQAPLVARLDEKRGPVVLLFDVADTVRSVPIDVPTFWLGTTAQKDLRIIGMGIVTRAMSVRVAARGFALANVARGLDTQVDTFQDLESATAWARGLLAAAP
jgi:hypothetical protein